MSDLVQNIEDGQQSIIDLLFTDLELGFTFLETARVTSVPDTKQRNVANAVKVHRTVSEKAADLPFLSATRQQLEAKLLQLSQQLATWGESV